MKRKKVKKFGGMLLNVIIPKPKKTMQTLPAIRIGMSKEEVQEELGEAARILSEDVWCYQAGRSWLWFRKCFLIIEFENSRVSARYIQEKSSAAFFKPEV